MKKKIQMKSILLYFILGCVVSGLLFLFGGRIYVFLSADGHSVFFNALESIFTGVSIASIFLLVFQIKGEHERCRREKAVDMLVDWRKSITESTTYVKNICEKLNDEQCRCLFNMKRFKVSYKMYKDIAHIIYGEKYKKYKKKRLRKNCKKHGGQEIKLTVEEIKKLRWELVNYLNTLEIIMAAWRDHVIDADILEEQFDFLIDYKEGKTLLENFRYAAGGLSTFPAIAMFCNHLQEKRKKKIEGRAPIA